ncbi:stalk domain-containing protein [Thermoanaerobacterium thermosaccharolyticum]|uniref:stalk domain-containing protein n=1 Tax=Thermoanaerobacterium thermosaccharolyticum TaxID=1517 RepID=UPI003D2ACF33
MDEKPEIVNNRVMVPIYWISKAFDINISWNQSTSQLHLIIMEIQEVTMMKFCFTVIMISHILLRWYKILFYRDYKPWLAYWSIKRPAVRTNGIYICCILIVN